MKTILLDRKVRQGILLFTLLCISGPFVFSQSGGAVFETGPLMNRSRIHALATQLDDGRVAVFGGREYGFVSSTYADFYDTDLNLFIEVPMNIPHDHAAATRLNNGKYYISGGGMNSGIAPGYAGAEIFDPVENTFTSTNDMLYARMQHTAATLTDGTVLIAGGWYNPDGALNVELFDPETGTYSLAGSLNTPRAMPGIFPTNDGGAVIYGGWPSYGGDIITVNEYYDPAGNITVHSNQIIAEDPGWLAYGYLGLHVYSDYKMLNGNYVFMAYRYNPELEYALITFNPATKNFSRIATSSPLLDDVMTGGIYDFTIDRNGNMAYLIANVTDAFPTAVGIIAVDLASGEVFHPEAAYSLEATEYLFPTITFMPANGKILLIGISTSGVDYFHSTNQTYLLTPEIIGVAVEDVVVELTEITCYPNPAEDAFFMMFNNPYASGYTVNMYDMSGNMVWTTTLQENNTGLVKWEFDKLNLLAGVYLITVNNEQFISKTKIVISQ